MKDMHECAEKIILFGAGIDGRKALDYFGRDKVLFFVDNSSNKIGKTIDGIRIISFADYLEKNIDNQVVITVDIRFLHVVAKQLEESGVNNYVSFYEIRNDLKHSDLLHLLYRENDLNERFNWITKHSDIRCIGTATGYLRRKQLELLDFCKKFFADIAELDIHPFLDGGNLIGAIRHGGFVPWDDDMDFCLMRDEYDKLIKFAKEHYVVRVFEGRQSEQDNDVQMTWIDKIIRDNPEEYVFDVGPNLLQVNYGTSCIDRLSIDFFVFDYYEDGYTVEEHKEYLRNILKRRGEIDVVPQIMEFLKAEWKNNPHICNYPTGIVFPGIDDQIASRRLERIEYLTRNEDYFPLKKVKYEDTWFYAPNNPDRYLGFEYPGYMEYPDDAGRTSHFIFREKYMTFYLPTVDFYISSTENIAYFEPLYEYFEHNGIYSRFLIVKKGYRSENDSYITIISKLDELGVRYYKSIYSESDCILFESDCDGTFEYKSAIELHCKPIDEKKMEELKNNIIIRWDKKREIATIKL